MSLITSTTYKLLKQWFRVSQWFHTLPFIWNKRKNRIELQESKWAKRHFIFSMFAMGMFAIFASVQAVRFNFDDTSNIRERFQLRQRACTRISIWLIQVFLYWKREEIVSFFNMYMDFLEYCQVAYKTELSTAKITQKRCYVALILVNFVRVNVLLTMIVVFSYPRNPEQIHAMFMTSAEPGAIERVLAAAYFLVCMISGCECVGVLLTLIIFFMSTMNSLGRLVCSMLTPEGTSILKFRRTCRLYRSMYLMCDEFSELLKMTLGCLHVTFIIVVVYMVYMGVRLTGFQRFTAAFSAVDCLVLMLTLEGKYAEVNTASKTFLQQLKVQDVMRSNRIVEKAHRQLLQREGKCLRECRIRVGSLYYYDTDLLISTMEIILQNSVNLTLIT